MHNSKIYYVLEHFDRIEQNRLRKYITSPYFNKNQTLVDLFELLVKHQNNGRNKTLEKEAIWPKLNLKDEFDDVRFRKLCSELLKLVEGYLAQEVYEENRLSQAVNLMEAIGKRKMERLFNSSFRIAKRLSNQEYFKSGLYYLDQYRLEKTYYDTMQLGLDRASKTNVEVI